MKNNTSVSECCDEVSLLACSVAAACYLVSLQINILLQFQHVSSFQINQLVSQIQIICNCVIYVSCSVRSFYLKKYRSDYALQVTMEISNSENLQQTEHRELCLSHLNYVDGISADNNAEFEF